MEASEQATDPGASQKTVARLEQTGNRLMQRLRQRPYLGITLAGGAAIALAASIGVGEVALGLAAAYATYRILGRHAQTTPPKATS
jgi:hypothetical protein